MGAVLCTVGCLLAPLPSIHWMDVAPPPLVVKAKTISIPCQMAPGGASAVLIPIARTYYHYFSPVEDLFLVFCFNLQCCHGYSSTHIRMYMSMNLAHVCAETQYGWIIQCTQLQGDQMTPAPFQRGGATSHCRQRGIECGLPVLANGWWCHSGG